MDLCDDVDTHLARTIPRICATNKFDAQIHGNVRRCGAGFNLFICGLLTLNSTDLLHVSDLAVHWDKAGDKVGSCHKRSLQRSLWSLQTKLLLQKSNVQYLIYFQHSQLPPQWAQQYSDGQTVFFSPRIDACWELNLCLRIINKKLLLLQSILRRSKTVIYDIYTFTSIWDKVEIQIKTEHILKER